MFFDLVDLIFYIIYGAIIEAVIISTLLVCLSAAGLLMALRFFSNKKTTNKGEKDD